MASEPRAWGSYTYYRVEPGDGLVPTSPGGEWVGVDAWRVAHDGDLVAVEAPEDHRTLVGRLRAAAEDPLLLAPSRPPVVLRGHALLGVVALVVQEFA